MKTKLHMICSKSNLSLTKENYFEEKLNKFGLKSYCKGCQKIYKRERVICKVCNSANTRFSYKQGL